MTSKNSEWHVSSHCINCMASRTMAPTIIEERSGKSVFSRQPESTSELKAAWLAESLCPVKAISAPSEISRPEDLFPQILNPSSYRLGHNAKSSYGAHSYYIKNNGKSYMIDGPSWSEKLVQWISKNGGLDHILLTHRDDIADADRYANHFNARVWIHEADSSAAPFATDVMTGDSPKSPAPSVEVIYMPGHTRGSVMYLFDNDILFAGDSLAWDSQNESFRIYREYCWYDWGLQLQSLTKLKQKKFSQVFAGHGESISSTREALSKALIELLKQNERE